MIPSSRVRPAQENLVAGKPAWEVSGIWVYSNSKFGFRVSGLGFRVSGLGFRVSGLGFRVQVSG